MHLQKNGAESDEQLRRRFEKEILPKIQEQLKGLDQNEQPNSVTIELKRQLRVGLFDVIGRSAPGPRLQALSRWLTSLQLNAEA
jgi:hypothetical protein